MNLNNNNNNEKKHTLQKKRKKYIYILHNGPDDVHIIITEHLWH